MWGNTDMAYTTDEQTSHGVCDVDMRHKHGDIWMQNMQHRQGHRRDRHGETWTQTYAM